MSEQLEITEKTPLLNEDGTVRAKGWSRRCIVEYNRERIPKRLRIRRKEWDFYQVCDGELMLQINFANISIGAAATCATVNLRTGERHDFASIVAGTKNRFELASKTADDVSKFVFERGDAYLRFEIKEDCRELEFRGRNGRETINARITARHIANGESITIVTPFAKPDRFFLTTKLNCMPAEGHVRINDFSYDYDASKTYAVLDWGRGVWPYKNYWYWGNGSTEINGKPFGFEITWGIGDESNATETCLFYDGKAHKIGAVGLEAPPKIQGYMKPWKFASDDGRLNLTMTPFFDNETGAIVLGLLGMKCHQVHGLFNGTATLDDGSVLEIKDMYAFCEYVENRW